MVARIQEESKFSPDFAVRPKKLTFPYVCKKDQLAHEKTSVNQN